MMHLNIEVQRGSIVNGHLQVYIIREFGLIAYEFAQEITRHLVLLIKSEHSVFDNDCTRRHLHFRSALHILVFDFTHRFQTHPQPVVRTLVVFI